MPPLKPPRACTSPNCPLPANDCPNPAHKPTGWTPDHIRGNKQERGYGPDWDPTRQRILRRDNHTCTIEGCNEKATEVDHTLAKAFGGTDDDNNLRSLCSPHHRAKTSADATEGRRRAAQQRKQQR